MESTILSTGFYENQWVRVFRGINRPIITTHTWHHRLQLGYSCSCSDNSLLIELLLRFLRVFLFILFSFPSTYKFSFITSFSRPGPHRVEWSLHSRENHHPVDSAQWSLLLCCPVSRWINIFSTFIYSYIFHFLLSRGISCAHMLSHFDMNWVETKTIVWQRILQIYMVTLPSCV